MYNYLMHSKFEFHAVRAVHLSKIGAKLVN